MKLWKNTATLDHLVPALMHTADLRDAELAVIGSKPLDLPSMPNLRGIFKCGVGTDNVPFEEAKDRQIQIRLPSQETRQYIFEETANFAVYLIFRMLYADLGDVEAWKKVSRPFLGRKKVLIIGKGNIGSHVCRKLAPAVEVLSFDALENQTRELRGMVEQADVISLHVPLIDDTRGMIDAEKLSWIKDGAALVNTARAPIVDEDALYEEVSSGRIRAAFDVFWQEPYIGRLRQFHPEGFLMSPHVASTCEDFLKGLAKDFYLFVDKLR